MRDVASPRWHWGRCRNQDRELPEVLNGGGKVESSRAPFGPRNRSRASESLGDFAMKQFAVFPGWLLALICMATFAGCKPAPELEVTRRCRSCGAGSGVIG